MKISCLLCDKQFISLDVRFEVAIAEISRRFTSHIDARHPQVKNDVGQRLKTLIETGAAIETYNLMVIPDDEKELLVKVGETMSAFYDLVEEVIGEDDDEEEEDEPILASPTFDPHIEPPPEGKNG